MIISVLDESSSDSLVILMPNLESIILIYSHVYLTPSSWQDKCIVGP